MSMEDTEVIRYILAGILFLVMCMVERYYKRKEKEQQDKLNRTRYIQVEPSDTRR